jgi:paraquat-inducible protein A
VFRKLLSLLELIFFSFGISLPLLSVSEFWFFKNEVSLINIVYGLFENAEYLLALIVAIFGVLIPLIKVSSRLMGLKFLEKFQLHKFAMLDIFLISFIVFSSKFASLFDAKIGVGFYFLLASILIGFVQISRWKSYRQ